MRLGMISLVIALTLGVTLGVLQTVRKERAVGPCRHSIYRFASTQCRPWCPTHWCWCSVQRYWAYRLCTPTETQVHPSILPIVCLSMASIAGYALWTRRYMVDELTRDYIKLAKIEGPEHPGSMMVGHVTAQRYGAHGAVHSGCTAGSIGGSLLVERFFSVPGMGPLLTDAINRYDTNVVRLWSSCMRPLASWACSWVTWP